MKTIGSLHPTEDVPLVPENIAICVISTAGAIVAQDYPAGAQIMHFDAHATIYFHPSSTGVAIPTTSQVGSTSQNRVMRLNNGHEGKYQIPADSTGYSITSETSGITGIQFWRK